jgi:hypothetical protein
MAKAITNYVGPGGSMNGSYGTCTVGDTVQSQLTRVEDVLLTYSNSRSGSDAHLRSTSRNATPGSFVVGGQSSATVFWVAFGY